LIGNWREFGKGKSRSIEIFHGSAQSTCGTRRGLVAMIRRNNAKGSSEIPAAAKAICQPG